MNRTLYLAAWACLAIRLPWCGAHLPSNGAQGTLQMDNRLGYVQAFGTGCWPLLTVPTDLAP